MTNHKINLCWGCILCLSATLFHVTLWSWGNSWMLTLLMLNLHLTTIAWSLVVISPCIIEHYMLYVLDARIFCTTQVAFAGILYFLLLQSSNNTFVPILSRKILSSHWFTIKASRLLPCSIVLYHSYSPLLHYEAYVLFPKDRDFLDTSI